MLRGLLIVAVVMGALSGSWVLACCMVPTTYPGDVDQTRQDVVIVHHGGVEQLLIRVQPTFPDLDYGPTRMAWLITIPAPASDYEALDPAVFDEAEKLYKRLEALADEQRRASQWASLGADSDVPKGEAVTNQAHLEIGAPVQVGPYEITPVRGRGPAAAEALNAYLTQREFPAESADELRWFTERDFTFLCIEVQPETGQETLGKNIELPALRLQFPTERPYYPARYSARQGNFALGLTLLTSEPLARDSILERRRQLDAYSGAHYSNLYTVQPLPATLASSAGKIPGAAGVHRWYANALPSWGFNRGGNSQRRSIADWDDDIFFEIGGADDLPPSWYYGDSTLGSLRAKLTRGPVLFGIGFLAAAAGVFIWRRRRQRAAQSPAP